MACVVNRFMNRSDRMPPATARGIESKTSNASQSERNIAASTRNSTTAATARLMAIVESASSRRSAVPRYCTLIPAGMISLKRGPATSRSCSSASCTVISSGGVTLSVIVRWPSTRRNWVGPTVRRMSASSPMVWMPASGVAIGVDASCSGESQMGPRRIMSMRSLPSKYSPTKAPLVSARTMLARAARSRPAAVMRRSLGTSCSSGSAMAGLGFGLTCAPGSASLTMPMLSRTTDDRSLMSLPEKSTLIARPPSNPKLSSEDRWTNACVSGRSTSTSSRTIRIISSMRAGSCG